MLKRLFVILVYVFAAIGFVLVVGYFAVRFGLTNTTGIIDQQREAFFAGTDATPAWANTEEWSILQSAIRRDVPVINRAASDAGIPARLIVANLVAEQLRLFFTDREDYKQFFYPLKILGPQTQFSWGVMGMKEETAIQVEHNLSDTSSPYYLGPTFAHLLDFPATTTDIASVRFTRMTDQHDHYWSYLYAGLYMKEVEAQWMRAGHAISNQPAIVSTLFNIGFTHSLPNADPKIGGAAITVASTTQSFGALAAEFYYSDLLLDTFPR